MMREKVTKRTERTQINVKLLMLHSIQMMLLGITHMTVYYRAWDVAKLKQLKGPGSTDLLYTTIHKVGT